MPADSDRLPSVHLSLFLAPETIAPPVAESHVEDWTRLFQLRDEVLKALEEARQAKRIGKSLEAKLQIASPGADFELLRKYASSLKELLNVSQVELAEGDALQIALMTADGEKCERCWNYRTDIGVDSRWPTVCGRCVPALEEIVPLMLEQAQQEAAQ
jgi:isoleucyl-tRNA synthetase